MPKWQDYKKHAQERGALAWELYAVVSQPGDDPSRIPEVLPDHLAYQGSLEAEGKLVLAGPMSDETGALMEGVGLIIYRASGLEEARALADADPMHKEGVRHFTIRRWLVNEGSLSLSVKLSGQSVTLK